MADYRDHAGEERAHRATARSIAKKIDVMSKKLTRKGGFSPEAARAIAEAILEETEKNYFYYREG